MKAAAAVTIAVWHRVISPWLPPSCRFYPSCSAYAAEAIASQGLARGCWLAVKRVARCHPFHPGGADFPPRPEGLSES